MNNLFRILPEIIKYCKMLFPRGNKIRRLHGPSVWTQASVANLVRQAGSQAQHGAPLRNRPR
jgi:hypothetical protein